MSSLHRSVLRALSAGARTATATALALAVIVSMLAVPRADASHLLVGSAVNNRILRFDGQTGAFVDPFVPAGGGGLVFPQGLAIGPDGHLYVKSNGNILRYNGQTGVFMGIFVQGFGADPSGQYFDFYYDATTGNFIQMSASGDPDLSGIVFGPDGHLYVSSHLTHSVLVYHGQTGAALGTFASGSGLTNPTGLTFGPDGHLYVSSYTGNKVLRFHGQTGAFLSNFVAAGSGGLNRPVGLVFGPNGKLNVSSANTDQVLCYDGTTGAFQAVFASGSGLDGPAGVVFGPDGHLYVSSTNTDRVLRFNGQTGVFINAFALPTGSGLDGPFFLYFALEAPSNLTTNVVSTTRIDLAWMDHSDDESGFEVHRRAGSGPFARRATLFPGVTTYIDNGLSPNTTYTYQVRAIHPGGASHFCPAVSGTTLEDPPAQPTGLAVAAASTSQLNLTWTDHSNDETGFVIFRRTSAEGYREIDRVGANVIQYFNTGLPPNTTYTYKVQAISDGGASPFTNEATGTTFPPPPAQPTNLSASGVTWSQVSLSWTDHSSTETMFAIFRRNGSGSFVQIDTVPANATGYTDASVNPLSNYTYKVRAAHATGVSAFTNEVAVTTHDAPPATPTNLAAQAVLATQVNLSWTDNSNNETAFAIFRKNGTGDFVRVGVAAANATSFPDRTVSPNVTYVYRVRAAHNTSASGWSNQVTVTTPPPPPATPTNLAASALAANLVKLTWTDNSNNETAFAIFRKNGSGDFIRVGVAPPNTTSFSDRTTNPTSTYTYRIRATHNTGVSGWSNQVTVTTPVAPPAAPTGLTCSSVTINRVNLSWTDNSTNEMAFAIYRKNGSGAFVRVGVVPPNATSFSDPSVSPNSTYTYRVRASTDTMVSNWSNEVTVTTPPAAPTNLTATAVSATKVNLSWTDTSTNELAFAIFRRNGSGDFVRVGVVSPNTTSFSDPSVSPSSTYTYRVRASTDTTVSPWSNEATANTPQDTPPATPTNLTAQAVLTTQVNLSWTDNSNDEMAFAIFRRNGSGDFIRVGVVSPNVTSFSDPSVSLNSTYTYKVRASTDTMVSNWSNEVTVTTPPAAPTNLTAIAVSPTRVNLSWTDNSTNETQFAIFRRNGSGDFIRVGVVAANATSFADLSASRNSSYTYRVRAGHNTSVSGWSNEVSLTTPP